MNKIESMYNYSVKTPSDINEHLSTLKKYASECDHVTEMGVRWVVSTYAFVVAKPKTIVSIDLIDPRNLVSGTKHWDRYECGKRLSDIVDHCLSNNINYKFILGDTTKIEIEETDLLFIDTLHTYSQLKKELELHGNKSKKYIIFHDTTSHRYINETPEITEKTGIWPAIEEFLNKNKHWKIDEIFENCNGLTILKKQIN